MIIQLNERIIFNNNNLPNTTVNFTNGQKVVDEIRGYLIYVNSSWCFIGYSQYKTIQRTNKLKKLAIILESPHKDEYSSNFTPLRPANGKTGKGINTKLTGRSFIANLNTSVDYEVFLMNPIQFQCSCIHFIGNNANSKITKQIFRALFNKKNGNLRSDFISRLKNYNPDFILNVCTSGLKTGVVKNAIKEALPQILANQYKEDKHPSVW